jgi:UPF0755 protein
MSGPPGRRSGRRQPIPRRDPAEIEAHLRNRDRSAIDARLRSRERTTTGAERIAARERVAERVAPGGTQRGVDRGAGYDVRGRRLSPRIGRRSNRRTWIVLASLVSALLVAAVAVPPLAGNLFRALAEQNPDLVRVGFIADAVAEVMDGRPGQPAGSDPTPVDFVIEPGTGSGEITADLLARELVTDPLAFTYVLVTEGGINELQAGVHVLNRTMSPRAVAETLQQPPFPDSTGVPLALRDGLRLHQVVAYLQTLPLDNLDIHEFYELAIDPPASLLEEFEWLRVLPEGASLEGFLGAGIFDVDQDIDARGMLGTLLQRWGDSPSSALIAEAEQQGKDFYSVVTLASIVEREAALDREKALIAGVFQNRLDGVGEGRRLLQSDSALIYAKDTMRLRELAIVEWPNFVFWTFDGLPDPRSFETSPDLVGYHTWRTRGLPPGPIATPSLGSIEAALEPDADDGYLYFLSKLDGSNEHVFASTYAEHLENIDRYLRGASPTPLIPPTAVPAP